MSAGETPTAAVATAPGQRSSDVRTGLPTASQHCPFATSACFRMERIRGKEGVGGDGEAGSTGGLLSAIGVLRSVGRDLLMYARWQVEEGADHHPTLPSAIARATAFFGAGGASELALILRDPRARYLLDPPERMPVPTARADS